MRFPCAGVLEEFWRPCACYAGDCDVDGGVEGPVNEVDAAGDRKVAGFPGGCVCDVVVAVGVENGGGIADEGVGGDLGS